MIYFGLGVVFFNAFFVFIFLLLKKSKLIEKLSHGMRKINKQKKIAKQTTKKITKLRCR